ncbi:pilus assembly protein [Paenibacillus kobensis]|uniref:pilus assembly protein n=1 Tax=Paenibacillus kobensis TaxID=59841 RepID=UPI000FDB8B09|nr:pilus assembly protein [Paenibacillus kobensis]
MRSLVKEESGSYTLEATLVLPIILIIVAVMLLFTGYSYEKTVLYGAAVVTSERTAFLWDNSNRDVQSGNAAADQYDGLYWRIGEDGMLQSLFGLSGSDRGEASRIIEADRSGEAEEEGDDSLAERKLARSSALLSDVDRLQGEIRYDRGTVTRRITTMLRLSGDAPLLARWLGRSEPGSSAASVIVEPTEFIRTIDLVRYYTSKFGNGKGSTAQLQQAGATIQRAAGKRANG